MAAKEKPVTDMSIAEIASAVAQALKGECVQETVSTIREGERAVVVCTNLRGVFFGYATNTDGDSIKLRNARNAFYWKATGGLLELGASGPKIGSKIGDRADIELKGISCVIECTPDAVKAWETSKWAS